ncbi:hypothetical protein MMC11_000844 [Xylographa trunciseda]|nr:hypothetical protein [Xylographa trunciseda]
MADCLQASKFLFQPYQNEISNLDQPRRRLFGPDSPSSTDRLPQGMTIRTCSLSIDVVQTTVDTWATLHSQLTILINRCVRSQSGIGGTFVHNMIEYTVANDATVSTSDTCMTRFEVGRATTAQCLLSRARRLASAASLPDSFEMPHIAPPVLPVTAPQSVGGISLRGVWQWKQYEWQAMQNVRDDSWEFNGGLIAVSVSGRRQDIFPLPLPKPTGGVWARAADREIIPYSGAWVCQGQTWIPLQGFLHVDKALKSLEPEGGFLLMRGGEPRSPGEQVTGPSAHLVASLARPSANTEPIELE